MNLKRHILLALFYFLMAALMGVLLRFFYVVPIPLNFKFILHAHSHTALLGWVYLGLTTLIYKIFLVSAEKPILYKRIFWFANFCIFGMLVTFPIQGYALFSIIFSTLFLFASYSFFWFAIKFVPVGFKNRFSWKLVKMALWYLVISSIGPWAIGLVMATLGNESIWYKTSIYFYLHFLYNGWFIFVLLGVLFYFFEEKGVRFNPQKLRSFFFLLNIGAIFTVFLSILWFVPPVVFYILGLVGAVSQILAFYELFGLLKEYIPILKKSFTKYAFFLLKFSGILIVLKLFMQLFSAFPYVANLAFQVKDFVIGYLHMVFLGIVVAIMLIFLERFRLLHLSKNFLRLYLIAFTVTEILIFYKAIAFSFGVPVFPNYYPFLAFASLLFPISVAVLFFGNFFAPK